MIYPDYFTPSVKRFKKLLEPIFLPNGGNKKWELILILYVFVILIYSIGKYYVHGALYQELKTLSWLNSIGGKQHTIAPGYVVGSVSIYFTITLSTSLFLVFANFFESGKSLKDIVKNHMFNTALKHLIFLSIIILISDSINVILAWSNFEIYYEPFKGTQKILKFNENLIYSYLIGHGSQFFLITILVFLRKHYKSILMKFDTLIKRTGKERNNSTISPNEALRKMKKINELLNQGIIDQNEYEDLKNDIKKKTDLNLDRI